VVAAIGRYVDLGDIFGGIGAGVGRRLGIEGHSAPLDVAGDECEGDREEDERHGAGRTWRHDGLRLLSGERISESSA
jgi:hypothetical protein